jgi:hypothetical protein
VIGVPNAKFLMVMVEVDALVVLGDVATGGGAAVVVVVPTEDAFELELQPAAKHAATAITAIATAPDRK